HPAHRGGTASGADFDVLAGLPIRRRGREGDRGAEGRRRAAGARPSRHAPSHPRGAEDGPLTDIRRSILAAALAVSALVLSAGNVPDADLWGHLRFGQDML